MISSHPPTDKGHVWVSTTYNENLKKMTARKTYIAGSVPSYANVDMPCRCLCLGLAVQYIYTRPRRFTVLQNSHIFFTDERTFMVTTDESKALIRHFIQTKVNHRYSSYYRGIAGKYGSQITSYHQQTKWSRTLSEGEVPPPIQTTKKRGTIFLSSRKTPSRKMEDVSSIYTIIKKEHLIWCRHNFEAGSQFFIPKNAPIKFSILEEHIYTLSLFNYEG